MKNLFETPYIDVVKFPADVFTGGLLDSNENFGTDNGETGPTESGDLTSE